jgi:hypothetical protein
MQMPETEGKTISHRTIRDHVVTRCIQAMTNEFMVPHQKTS